MPPPQTVLAAPSESIVEDTAPHRLAQGAASLFVGRIVNFALQAAYFILLARLLRGAAEYGLFAGVFALVSTVTPYSAVGSSMLFMRYVSTERSMAPVYWGNALLTTSLFTLAAGLLTLLCGVTGHLLAHPYMTAALVLANCLFAQVTTLAAMLLFTLDRLRLSAVLNTVANAARLLAVVLLAFSFSHVSAALWSAAFTLATCVAAVCACAVVHRCIGVPRFDLGLLQRRLPEGLGFSFAGTTEAVNNDIDKVMLAHFGLDLQNGFYTLAYRVIDFATAPIGAATASVTQRAFQLAHQGIAPVMRLARRSLWVTLGMGLALVLPVIAAARFVPALVGPGYAGVVPVLWVLCWLPAIRAVHQSAGAAITGLGRQPLRTASQASAAGLSVVLNLLWIPLYGWRGAACATLLCDGLMAVVNVVVLLCLNARQGAQAA